MAVYNYKKYKISLSQDSKKVQGLKVGDIVRRQYWDGEKTIYSLMCVLDCGEQNNPYFIGALLEGDAPKPEEILDFVRITNLFDTDRSGAMYLTSSDDNAPYMDIIDGIGYNESLCWPNSISSDENIDSTQQYVIKGKESVDAEYLKGDGDVSRILHLKFNSKNNIVGLKQDFYQYVENPNRVLISYKSKASRNMSAKATLGYSDGSRVDGSLVATLTTEWNYNLHAITVDWSGRHLRSFTLDFPEINVGDEVWIADLNIILLSSVANFADASKTRIGKLDGISDPVFGKLNGYGSYIQKLFASTSANISGTLTAGDENGFGSTFYAGKIHKNVFVNSMNVSFIEDVEVTNDLINPTGVGNVYKITDNVNMEAQSKAWLSEHANNRYCFSFWAYSEIACKLALLQNGKMVEIIDVDENNVGRWNRYHTSFDLFTGDTNLILSIYSKFTEPDQCVYFTAPQLESGNTVTQYQPTDDIVCYSEDYGAWFSRGGVGGTIQNPLLKLNYDGEGSIGTRTNSFLLRTDGSGYLANKNILWDHTGKVEFGEKVTLNWTNFDSSIQDNITPKSIKITGANVFTVEGSETSESPTILPQSITLTLNETNISSNSDQRKWYHLKNGRWILFENETANTLIIIPSANYWNGEDSLTVKCEVSVNDNQYIDTFTIYKQYSTGYTIKVQSSTGEIFKNGRCSTTLTAYVYHQGVLVSNEEIASKFTFLWHKYTLPDTNNEDTDWYKSGSIDRTKQSITLDYQINNTDMFICELISK